ncbi:MAG: disulfide bond formation protein DsbA [Candidatus Omnitrophica bacterium CG11_big_fil_rev_8_21_14_0_20_45_26]|uniref:Disulfide bond formation protein DsbA n=1 Tax=Candidatus Abzuiibacterium crystallinum TaxID=1974748 RepID=A0A2H0LLQ4_9BACT|nr:MAG: disulfide bond formation protein DsbA [Candidatus Omnitrophica bacterium CG11_big_fil_rev_8_21_14_0_20_45_26]PIW63222.1 MAG: disulfide bond formation protein DsbA [Candidatus Omnitrophica bacterium CG12_big_fil_rev_8_21_14_0_65_45_16]
MRQARYVIVGVIIIGVLVALVMTLRHLYPMVKPAEVLKPSVEKLNTRSKGPNNAPIVIVEYSDYQCPSCRTAQEPLHKILEQFPGLIRLESKSFPLQMHRYSFLAALAAECAGTFGKFWLYHELLFEQQSEWAKDPDAMSLMLAYANDLQIPIEPFVGCLDKSEMGVRVKEDKRSGELLSVNSTPTFFINGERFVGAKQLSEQGTAFIKEKLNSLTGK